MQFLLIICHDNLFMPSEALTKEIIGWNGLMAKQGILKYSNPLRPAAEAITIRVRKDKPMISKGPFAVTNEKVAAYALIDCPNMEEAIGIATTHPMAREATIEVRQIWSDISK